MAALVSIAALLLAILGWARAQGAHSRARRLQATMEELVTLMEFLCERDQAEAPGPAAEERRVDAAAKQATGQPVAIKPGPACTWGLAEGPAAGKAGFVSSDVRRRVVQLDGLGTSRSAISRETGLSQGEVRLLLAAARRTGGIA